MMKLTPDERAELMSLRAHLAKRRTYQRKYRQRADVKVKRRAYQQRADVKVKQRAYQHKYKQRADVKAKRRAYEANIRRLVSLAKAAGLDGASPSPDQEIQEIV